jgi:hypothetical protein
MSDSDDEVIIASSSKANSGNKYDIKNKTVITVNGKKRTATKPAGKQPAKLGQGRLQDGRLRRPHWPRSRSTAGQGQRYWQEVEQDKLLLSPALEACGRDEV